MGDSFRLDATGLRKLAARFENPAVRKAILEIPRSKAIAALVGQAIADNFDKEGPGWKPLKGRTLRQSVGKALLKHAQRQAARAMGLLKINKKSGKTSVNRKGLESHTSDSRVSEFHSRVEKILVEGEKHARKVGAEPGRMILQKTGTLKKVATTPAGSAINKDSGSVGRNTYRVEGTNLIWGVDLVYARTQNRGDESRNIPARPFLVVREEWMAQINDYTVQQILQVFRKFLLRGQ